MSFIKGLVNYLTSYFTNFNRKFKMNKIFGGRPLGIHPIRECDFNVHSLRESGYKVRVTHYRRYVNLIKHIDKNVLYDLDVPFYDLECSRYQFDTGFNDIKHFYKLSPTGGFTLVEIKTPDGQELVGESRCSNKDFYNRKEGVRIALERAMKSVLENKNDSRIELL